MSVAESKAKSTKKSTAAKEATEALKGALEAAQLEYLPLSVLVKSPLNVRTIPYSAEGVRELAESIASVGLLQNLVVHALDDGRFGVAAGGRRLTAMMHLADIGTFSPDQPVAVKRVPDELAVVASLTENGQRRDMHPAEQIVGFRTLAAEGKTPAQIGDLLGYGSRHVQRMLKLTELAPAILEALAKDELNTEHCHALALENDQTRQMQVLDIARQKGWNGKIEVRDIRSLITENEVSTASAQFQFVGETAFKDDEIRRDLFSLDEGGFVDTVLLETRMLEKLVQTAEDMKATEGWSWCLGRMDRIRSHGEDVLVYDTSPEPEPDAVYTADENERLEGLKAKLDAFDSRCEESDAVDDEINAIEHAAMLRGWTPERKARTGVVVSWHSGEMHVQRGVLIKEAREENESEQPQIHTYKRTPEPADEMSLPLVNKMSSERTLAVQAALMQQPQKAVAMLVWTLCQKVFVTCSTVSNPLQISLNCPHYSLRNDAPTGENGTAWLALMTEKKRLQALLPKGWEKDFILFFSLSGELMMSLMALCAAFSLNGVQTREHGFTSRSPLDPLETALGFHLRDWWQPTNVTFFGLLSKTQIVDALNDAGLTGAARDAEKMKKGDAAEYAESQMSRNRWVPDWMKAPVTQAAVAEHDDTTYSDTQQSAA